MGHLERPLLYNPLMEHIVIVQQLQGGGTHNPHHGQGGEALDDVKLGGISSHRGTCHASAPPHSLRAAAGGGATPGGRGNSLGVRVT